MRLTSSAPVKPGDGLVFDGDETTGRPEQGGRVYEVISLDQKQSTSDRSDNAAEVTGRVELRFGREAIDLRRLEVGQQVWKTDDPELTRRLRRSFEGPPNRKVDARPGRRRRSRASRCASSATTAAGRRATVESAELLGVAESRPADLDLFRTQLGRLGGTIYQLADSRPRSRAGRWCR